MEDDIREEIAEISNEILATLELMKAKMEFFLRPNRNMTLYDLVDVYNVKAYVEQASGNIPKHH